MFDLNKRRLRNKNRDSNNSSPLVRRENPIEEDVNSETISVDDTP